MKVLVTGGTGLIGRALASALDSRGDEILILSRNPDKAQGLPKGARVHRWDGKTAQGWGHLVEGVDAVVNLAGANIASGRWTARRKREIVESRLNAGKAALQAIKAAEHRPEVLVQASAVGYYGPHGDEVVTEESPPGNDFLARLAVEWEKSTARVEEMGVRHAVIRTGIVLSTEGGALPRMMLPFRFFAGGVLGSGRQWMSWIHIADEVSAILFLLDNRELHGPFNLTAPNPVTNAEFTKTLAQTLGKPAFMKVPSFALKAIFGEMATVLLDGQRAVPKRLQDAGFKFQFPELAPALKDLLNR